MGVNRFIDYANPMYWAKMLRKGGIPKRKPYSFTVKIADYVVGKEAYNNTAKCGFGNQTELVGAGEKTYSEIYDTSKQSPELIWEFTAGSENHQGFSLSPASKWKITAKDGTIYQGIIGDTGETSVEGLFTITRTDVKIEGTTLYYTKFTLTSKYDCVILDGCTIEFSPVFEEIQRAVLTASSKYEGTHTGLTGYDSDLWFYNKEAEKATKINEWIAIPGTGGDNEEFVYIENNKYMRLNIQTDVETRTEYAATVKYTPSEGAETTIKVMPITGNYNQYLIKLNFSGTTKEGYVNISPKDKTTVYVEVLYKENTATFATITANVPTEFQGKGLVQVNSGDIGNTSTAYLVAGDTAAFKATPIGGAKFDGWYESGGAAPVSTANPYNVQVKETMYGDGYSLYAKFSVPEASFTIRKKNYYDASITIEKENSVGGWDTVCQNYYDWSSSLPAPHGATLHKGDVLRAKMTYDGNGFENPKLYIGNQEIDYTQYATDGYKFMLDETTADAQYELTLKDGYGAVFAEVYPDKYKWSAENPVKVSVYTMEKTDEISDRFKAAKIPFTDSRWSKQIEESKGWQTKAINLKNDAGENIEYWVGFEFHPNKSGETEKAPFLSSWRDAVLAQRRGGAYKFVHNNTLSLALEGRYKFARLSCNLVDGTEKTAKLGTFKIASFTTDGNGTEVPLNASAQLVMHDSQTLLSMFEESPKCIFDRTYDNLVRISSVSQTLTHESKSYTFNAGGCYAGPQELVKDWFIDGGGMGTVTFTDVVKSTENPVITLYLNYNETPQTEEEFLKSNIAEAKEKLVDAIEALEKDYDDGKEDVIEETPVKDEPDTDEADVAEAVLATEPAEDKE